MEEKELLKIIKDLWCCVNKNEFRDYLWNCGMEAKDINDYVNEISNIYFNK